MPRFRLRVWLRLGFLLIGAACQTPAPAVTPQASTAQPPPPTIAAATAKPAQPAAASPSPEAKPSAVAVGSPRVDVLNAANAAFQRGNMTEAAQLYERVANTPAAPGEPPPAQVAVNDFAHFRAMLAFLAAGDEDQAREHLEALRSRDQNAPLARLGAQVWDQYGMTASIKAACVQAQANANQAAQVLSALQALGVSVDPNSLCSVP